MNPTITTATSVDDIVARHPIAFTVLNDFGVDTCCGGSASLGDAAAHAHVDEAELLAALERAVRDAGDVA